MAAAGVSPTAISRAGRTAGRARSVTRDGGAGRRGRRLRFDSAPPSRCLHRPPPAAPHRRSDGAPASPLRYSARARAARLPPARESKQAMGFRRCMLRGLATVRGEWHLVCAAFNLRRLRALGVELA